MRIDGQLNKRSIPSALRTADRASEAPPFNSFPQQRQTAWVAEIAPNVFSFTKRREPTVRAAKAFPPPFTEADYLARGGQRRNAPRRVKLVLCGA
jgi:hypothetical protein